MRFKKILKKSIKKVLPSKWVNFLIIQIEQNGKRKLAEKVAHKHKIELVRIKHKKPVRVVFMAIHDSVWKVDPVFRDMLADPLFDPLVLVCPYVSFGEERMLEDMEKTYDFFIEKCYPVVRSYDQQNNTWVRLEDLAPDILFFTNPHNLTRPEYYCEAYSNYLSCYVPYHYEVGKYSNNQDQYNQYFHNAMWLIFAPHECSKNTYASTCAIKGRNVVVTGYPGCEDMLEPAYNETISAWKTQDKHKTKIIWAPHHTIDSKELPYSNFLKYAENFKQLAINFNDTTQWSFKPHPLLKSRLYDHRDWGREKTDAYYNFWESQPNTQLNLGPYTDLFKQSDAMIHDCGSFLAEYLYMKKPVLYMAATENYRDFYNEFGIEALNCCVIGLNLEDIHKFITKTISSPQIKPEHIKFFDHFIHNMNELPSKKIINEIKTHIWKE